MGQRIRTALEHRGWKQNQLAAAVGHSTAWVSDFLKKPEMGTDLVRKVAAALDIEASVFLIEDDEAFEHAVRSEPEQGRSASGIERQVVIENRLGDGNMVRGPLAYHGAEGPAAGVHKALKNELRRRGGGKTKSVPMAGVPEGTDIIELDVPLRVTIDGVERLQLPPGRLLVVDTKAEPQPRDIELVVAAKDPDPYAAPTKDDPEPSRGRAVIMRYEPGPRGIKLLFSLDSNEAVTTAQGWRIVGVVVDDRPPPRS